MTGSLSMTLDIVTSQLPTKVQHVKGSPLCRRVRRGPAMREKNEGRFSLKLYLENEIEITFQE